MRLLVDGRWVGSYGIARFSAEVLRRLPWGYRRLTLGRPATLLDPVIAAAALAALRPDVYFTPGFCPPLGPTRVPYVVTIHDLIHLDESAEASVAKSAFYAGIVRPGVRRAARVVTVSEHSRARIVEWAGIEADRVIVAPNGVSSAFTPGGERFDPGHDYLLYVGNSKPHKNLRTLLAALSALGADAPPLYLAGVDAAVVQREAADRGVGHLVHCVGALPDAELARMYRGALALVFPSRFEGFGLPVLEAMACGTPVVASAIPPVREIAGAAAEYVDPNDPSSVAEGIRRVLGDDASPGRSEQQGSHARRIVHLGPDGAEGGGGHRAIAQSVSGGRVMARCQ